MNLYVRERGRRYPHPLRFYGKNCFPAAKQLFQKLGDRDG